MLTAITLGTTLILYIILLITYKTQAKYKRGMLFAVTLPPHAVEDERIQRVQAQYNKQLMKVCIVMGALLIPLILLYNLWGYQTIYMLVWIIVCVIVFTVPFRTAFKETLGLKRDNDWFVGAKRVIHSDLRVEQLKNERSAPMSLYLIPVSLNALLTLWIAQFYMTIIGLAICGWVMTAICMLTSLGMRGTKAKVYSENSEINVSLNQAKRRAVSYMWLWIAIVENIHFALLILLLTNENEVMNGTWLTLVLLFSIVPVGIVLNGYRKFHALEQEVLEHDGKQIYSDDDEYWANGFTYHNPHDRSLMVPKRVGIGETINTGTLAGKIIMGGILGLVATVIVGTSFLIIRSEITSPSLTITPTHQIEIDYPMYSVQFDISEIEAVTLVDTVPSGSKTNGEATDKVLRGQFRLKELGKSRLYLFKNNPPYIQIKLKDSYIFYNDQDPLVTEKRFEEIKQSIDNRF
ncbi:MAG: DUF5808 domain-containing protein [Candidatus Cohnella colombiensis]|uniref:DUF5808 domain-containing protein n=1 Tax=Candidatus Cohnella colombiensis TaxID=3121368 RepID=A0AA95EXN6_9BACL|nr:MAG: DUF5808 domain-containing protein [Cohnella sp.]